MKNAPCSGQDAHFSNSSQKPGAEGEGDSDSSIHLMLHKPEFMSCEAWTEESLFYKQRYVLVIMKQYKITVF